jgi:hypothetical protein
MLSEVQPQMWIARHFKGDAPEFVRRIRTPANHSFAIAELFRRYLHTRAELLKISTIVDGAVDKFSQYGYLVLHRVVIGPLMSSITG